jgi:DNA-binding response OmpR family regulator
MLKTRILVVDDEKDLVWAVQHSLGDESYEVFTAYDGMEALAVARRHHPDLVILDICMPRLDGVQVCRRLRRNPTLATVPTLFLTVRDAIEDRIKGLDEGGDDYLVKPFDLGELKARVRALLRRARFAPEGGLGPEGRDFLLIEPDPTHPIYIRTVPHHGYTFERRKASPNATPT